jgi:hypothetical protein
LITLLQQRSTCHFKGREFTCNIEPELLSLNPQVSFKFHLNRLREVEQLNRFGHMCRETQPKNLQARASSSHSEAQTYLAITSSSSSSTFHHPRSYRNRNALRNLRPVQNTGSLNPEFPASGSDLGSFCRIILTESTLQYLPWYHGRYARRGPVRTRVPPVEQCPRHRASPFTY